MYYGAVFEVQKEIPIGIKQGARSGEGNYHVEPRKTSTSVLRSGLRMSVFALALVAWLTTLATQSVGAQTYSVLHNFTGGRDGANPYGSLILDSGGNLYGAAAAGGSWATFSPWLVAQVRWISLDFKASLEGGIL